MDIRKIAQQIVNYESVKGQLKEGLDEIPFMSLYVRDKLDKIIDDAPSLDELRLTLDVIWQASEVLDEKITDIEESS